MCYQYSPIVRDTINHEVMARAAFDEWCKRMGLVRKGHKPNTTNRRKRTDKRRYQVHIVWDLGKDSEIWVPLGMYPHIDGAYKRIARLREHHATERRRMIERGSTRIKTPVIFLEFKETGNVRAFNIAPEATLGMFGADKKHGTQFFREYHYPKGFILLSRNKIKKKKKR